MASANLVSPQRKKKQSPFVVGKKTSAHDNAYRVAQHLWASGAVQINTEKPFRWASGCLSPIYCDSRLLLSRPVYRSFVARCLTEKIKKEAGGATGVAGVATAGIPYATLVAEALGSELLYVRSQKKKHGLQRTIEGSVPAGQAVVLVEDVVSTGGSCLRAAQHVEEAGMKLLGIFCVFSYETSLLKENLEAFSAAKRRSIALHALSNFGTLLQVGQSEGHITVALRESITALWDI